MAPPATVRPKYTEESKKALFAHFDAMMRLEENAGQNNRINNLEAQSAEAIELLRHLRRHDYDLYMELQAEFRRRQQEASMKIAMALIQSEANGMNGMLQPSGGPSEPMRDDFLVSHFYDSIIENLGTGSAEGTEGKGDGSQLHSKVAGLPRAGLLGKMLKGLRRMWLEDTGVQGSNHNAVRTRVDVRFRRSLGVREVWLRTRAHLTGLS